MIIVDIDYIVVDIVIVIAVYDYYLWLLFL